MKLLFDQNLSRRLVALLADDFPDSSHVSLVGLAMSTDREVWEDARDHGYAIASKCGQVAPVWPPREGDLALRRQGTPSAGLTRLGIVPLPCQHLGYLVSGSRRFHMTGFSWCRLSAHHT